MIVHFERTLKTFRVLLQQLRTVGINSSFSLLFRTPPICLTLDGWTVRRFCCLPKKNADERREENRNIKKHQRSKISYYLSTSFVLPQTMLSRVALPLIRNSRVNASSFKGAIGAVRNLNVHEHISMEIFNQNGITTPGGAVAFTPEEAKEAFVNMGNRKFVVYNECLNAILRPDDCLLVV